jgi:hypothetical protein
VPKAKEQVAEADLALWLRPVAWGFRTMLGRPRDTVLALVCAFAIGGIVINSLYLQPGPHPAPIFMLKSSSVLQEDKAEVKVPRPRPVDARQPEPRSELKQAAAPAKAPQPAPRVVSTSRPDPIAELLSGSNQLTSVQRALSEFGYGPVAATGVYGPETRAAIERFERDRKLPVTGQVSDKLVRELSQLVGRPI